MTDITFMLKKRYGTIPAGFQLTRHIRGKYEVWGLPKDKNNFWSLEFILKHPEIFEPNN